ncbi:hypothetical protein GN244_ATG20463 [Phytophthora infestans]|uniref:Uncharacterized protein n=1 Tax=Phytophthora infestans TaxID=4787 RepID=A0A833S5Y5_PHYIN|nr:hypothetical protein GN244_ATG20463 [Phytophthora infestans]
MASNVPLVLELFVARDQIPESLSILTYMEEEDVEDYFEEEWDEQDAASLRALAECISMEATYSVRDSSSVLGVCATSNP